MRKRASSVPERAGGKGMYVAAAFVFLLCIALQAPAEAVKPEKSGYALNIQGFRPGMTMPEVKHLLLKKNIKRYETGFSDVFLYHPSPHTAVKLLFICSPKGQALSRIELTTAFTAEETELAVPKFKEKLVARYGMPSIIESQSDRFDFCWGECGEGASGTKLDAKITSEANGRALVLVLADAGMSRACKGIRHRKINGWLYQWISYVRKFRLGMSLKDASALYQKRYQDKLIPDEERDEAVQHYRVINYVVKDYDFFDGLDYESLAFEGEGPGRIVLKFTGDQAGKKSRLNKRLYYACFSTTKFSNRHSYRDGRQKLDKFIKIYGKPVDVFPLTDGQMASWQQDTKKITVTIFDSGLITFEQSDPSLRDAYRDEAVKKIEEFNKIRFDKSFF